MGYTSNNHIGPSNPFLEVHMSINITRKSVNTVEVGVVCISVADFIM